MRSSPGSGSTGRRGRCSTCALAQTVDYTNPLMKRLETQSHFVRGLLLVTNTPAGRARATGETGARRRRSEPDRHERQDDAAAGRSVVRSAASRGEPGRVVRRRRADARRRSDSMASLPIPWRSARTRSASGWRSAPIAQKVVAMVLNGAFRPGRRWPCARPAARRRRRQRSCSAQLYGVQVLGSVSPRSCRRVARCLRVRRGSYPGRTRSVHLADERPPGRISWRHPVGHACRTAACSSAPSP